MSPEMLETLAAVLGTFLVVGTFLLYVFRRKFGKPELVFCCVGAVLVIVPIVRQLKIKTTSIELDVQRTQRQVAQLQKNLESVAQVQDRIVSLQQESVRVAVAAPKERQEDATAVLGQLHQLDLQTAAIQKSMRTSVN